MRLALSIKNTSKAIQPSENDVMIYDGKDWYITTKDELLKETNALLKECQAALEETKLENEKFKKTVAKSLLDMSELIKKLYAKQGE